MANSISISSALRAVLFVCLAGAALAAALPAAIDKLEGSTAEVARSTMTQHGYVKRSEKSSWGRELTYWWSPASRQCVQLSALGGRVIAVSARGASDCASAGSGGSAGGAGGVDPAQLVGLPRQAVEARLAQAGFNARSVDESKPEAIYVIWSNGRQCLAGAVVGGRYERLAEAPRADCGI